MTAHDQGSPYSRLEMDPSAEQSVCAGDQIMKSKEVSQRSVMPSVSPVVDQVVDEISNMLSEIEEKKSQDLADEPFVNRPQFLLKEDTDLEDFLSLNFPRKLWKIVESDHINSIRWDDDGICVVINKELFKNEVLDTKIFKKDSIKNFIRQLNLYGFNKVQREFERSASLTEFLAEEETAAEFTKLQLYQNPNFRRGYPDLLGQIKRRVGIKKARSVVSSLEQDLRGENTNMQKCPDETGNSNDKPKRRRTTSTPSECFAMGQNDSHKLDPTTTSSASPNHMKPPLPAFTTMNPDLRNMQANLANLLSVCNNWFQVNMMAAASVISMAQSFHQRSPFYHNCPSCKCFENRTSAPSSSTTPTKGPEMDQDYMGSHK